MATITKSNEQPRKVGFWMDVDLGLKLELETYAGCQQYAREAGWRLILDPSIKRMHQWRAGRAPYDGILARATAPVAQAARKTGVPFVNLWLGSPALMSMPSVVADCGAAGVMAAEHLLGRGLRNFGYLGSARVTSSEMQFQGFRKTVTRAGFPCSAYRYPHSVFSSNAAQWGKFESGLEAWLNTLLPPIGICVYLDVFCRFLIDACVSRGLSVPGDVAIVGASDDTIICESSSPTLTSIDFGYERRGYLAAAQLDKLMNGAEPPSAPEYVPPKRLIPRQSSDVFAASDPLVAQALRFIAGRSDQKLSVLEVAAHVGVSRRTLERKFQEELGRGIAGEMVRLRLNRAKRWLADDKVALKTVAQKSGFRSTSHFSRVFTQILGVSPSEYRSQRRSRG